MVEAGFRVTKPQTGGELGVADMRISGIGAQEVFVFGKILCYIIVCY